MSLASDFQELSSERVAIRRWLIYPESKFESVHDRNLDDVNELTEVLI